MHRSRMIARRACDSAAFLAYQVKKSVPIKAAPYSRAAKTPASLRVVPKKEYKKLGTSSKMAPRVRQTTALMIIKVLRLILGSPFLKQIYANLLTLYKVMELT